MGLGIVDVGVATCILLGLVGYLYEKWVSTPRRVRVMLEKQGVRGPKPTSVLLGNIPEIKQIKAKLIKPPTATLPPPTPPSEISHNWTPKYFPHLRLWHQLYGRVFLYTTGNMQVLSVIDPDIIKEVTLTSTVDLGKPVYLSTDRGPLLGHGIVSSSGTFWNYQRKLMSPEFFPAKIKGMFGMMVDATLSMLTPWEDAIKNNGGVAEITIDESLRNLSRDIIANAAFGSSYIEGKHIFGKIRDIQGLMSRTVHVGIPGYRHLPTKLNRQIKALEKEIHEMIVKVVEARVKDKRETDFLQKMLEGANACMDQKDSSIKINTEKLIVDNCKTVYFAGHETTSSTAVWALMLMAANPDWQKRARAEVSAVCQNGIPTFEDLRSLKLLTMIIHETLRLYPPAFFSSRSAMEDSTLGNIKVPKGVDVQIPISLLHHDPEIWGEDVHEFKPERFANGIAGASKSPHAFVPFGFGARVCLGQHFAMIELKIVLSIILSRYTFSISPVYRHSPAFRLITEPEHGVQLIFRPVI